MIAYECNQMYSYIFLCPNFAYMSTMREIERGLDPVFASVGQRVFTNSYVEELRQENLDIKRGRRKRSKTGTLNNLIPQKGFQEQVLLCDADIKIIGGRRGGGGGVSSTEGGVENRVPSPRGVCVESDWSVVAVGESEGSEA